jgi:AbrB family looped-hinge helix DNA binding protein
LQTTRIKVRKKGQITLPQPLREKWGIGEGSEISLTSEKNQAIIRPIRKTKLRESAGSLGHPDKDEVEFAILDSEMLPNFYAKKYRR